MKKSKVIPTIVVLLLILSVSCFSVYYGVVQMSNLLMQSTFVSRRIEVDLIANTIQHVLEYGSAWDKRDYRQLLKVIVEEMDTQRPYVELFDQDLTSITTRNPIFENSPFNPLVHPEFLDIIARQKQGDIVLFTDVVPILPAHNIYLYFRWIPISKDYPDELLLVVGVSQHTTDVDAGNWLLISVVALIPLMVILIAWLGYLQFQVEALRRNAR